jgi:3-hydroxyacyl-CoA dehydrogenase
MTASASHRPAAPRIERVAVLGSGVMGATIAAHLANAGLEVLLLDVVPKTTCRGWPPATGSSRWWSRTWR